jgi:hypothetical protein
MLAAGRAVIIFGVLLCIWQVLIWTSERQYVATIRDCSVYQAYEGGLGFPGVPVPRVGCSLTYEEDGSLHSAVFDIRRPSNVEKLRESGRKVKVWISPITPNDARPLGIFQNLGEKVGGAFAVVVFGWFLVVTSRTIRV